MTKGLLAAAVSLLSLFLLNPVQANPRYSSIVIDADTGAVLHQDSADAVRYPASLTKMMTLYMLFEAMEQRKMTLDTPMKVSVHAASMPQTNVALRTGDQIKVRDAIPALIVRSANDVAAVVAEALGGSEANFGRMMTDKARQLGMRSTTFRNASGLPNGEQKTTARDMVTLSTRLMKDFPKYYHYFSTQSFSYKGVTYNSHNRMVRNVPGVDGLKTGFIRASGFNVATSAKRGNRRVVAVVMGGHTAAARDQHMAQLIDRSLNQGSRAIQVANNSKNTRAAVVSPVKVNAPTPTLKPYPEQQKMAEPVVTQRSSTAVTRAQPTQPHPQPRKVEQRTNEGWAVQIGSYHEPDRARANAQAAARLIPGEVAVTEVEISNRKLYRARLVGLQENQARSACQSLTRQGFGCLVVRS
ncbi:D-alanyl-D-alanine carboxypeptidase family protein [Nitrosomonas sp.]|uniref:D-alanyl-D-alanine carboxypeptidase family protein n=1 Tax=Nitrosomonas sp. TaxID=42353 RepID=UPI0025E2AF0A|nr:D-alanyl-D-alanine carboxypeptidase family protein [Nitrosomonas sp.]